MGRRQPEGGPERPAAAVRHVTIALDALSGPEAAAALAGADAVFCALGTTRGDAGSAEAFKKVDFEYVAAAAEAAKKAGARHFALVSAQGANANVWASDWKPLHPLLYTQTKGRAEEAVKAQVFPSVSIFRPGLLDRGDKARGNERLFLRLVTSVPVGDVAAVMVADAEKVLSGARPGGVRVFEMGEILSEAPAARGG